MTDILDPQTRPPADTVRPRGSRAGQAKVPGSATATSLLGLGPIPFSEVVDTHTMVAEANRMEPGTGALSQMESAVRAKAEKKAQRRLNRTVTGVIEPLIKTVKALHAEINLLDTARAQVKGADLVGIHGDRLAPEEATETHNQLRTLIENETHDGSHRHAIAPRHRVLNMVLLALDFPVFLFAMFGLFNVNTRLLTTDPGTQLSGAIAAMFALLGTMLLAVVMRRMGRRHRPYKTDRGSIDWPKAPTSVKIELVGVITLTGLAAGVMAARVAVEGTQAQASPWLLIALCALFAALVCFSAWINYRSEFDHGSTATDEVTYLSNQIRGRQNQAQKLAATRSLKVEQAGVNTAKLNRAITAARSTAIRAVTDSPQDKAIRQARSWAGNPDVSLPAPRIDFARLDLAEKQARELTDHQAILNGPAGQDDLFTFLTQEK